MQEKIYFHDRLLAATILKLIPRSITPNMVTCVRFVLTPVVLYLILVENYIVALPLFAFTALTDALDGSMARTRNQITPWGMVYDPVADKLLIGGVMLIFVMNVLNIYLALTVVAFELLFLIGGYLKKRKGDVIAANWWGKSKMLFQVAAVSALLLNSLFAHVWLIQIATVCVLIAIALSIINFLQVGARF